MKNHSFGKGLNTVYDVIELSKSLNSLEPQEITLLKHVSVADIIPGKYQPRKKIDQETLKLLADSIIQKGIMQPLIVREINNQYEIIAGERRWLAAQIAGLTTLPVVICNIDDLLILSYSLVENIQREDLSLIDKANAFWRMQHELKLTHEQIAQQVSCNRTTITNILRLLSLPESVKDMLQENLLDLGHARALVGLSYQQQEALARKIVARHMTVREVEDAVKKLKNKSAEDTTLSELSDLEYKANKNLKPNATYSAQLSIKLQSHVTVKLDTTGVGKIIIDIESAEYLEWLLENLVVKN